MSANAAASNTTDATPASPAAAAPASTTPAAGAQGSGTPAAAPAEKKPEGDKPRTSLLSVDPAKNETKPQGDAKTGEAPKGDQTKIEIKLPEGVKVDDAALKEFETVATTHKLSSEQASALAAWDYQRQQQVAKANEAVWDKQSESWAEALKKEHGDKFDAKLVAAKQTLLKYGGEPAARELNRLRIDNNPVLFNMLAAIGEAEGEDKANVGAVNNGDVRTKVSAKEKLEKFFDHPTSRAS